MTHDRSLSLALAGLIAFSTPGYTGKLDIVNENKKPLSIKVEAEGDSTAVSRRDIPSTHASSFEIKASDLNGKGYYSIKGDVNPFTPGDKCQHLSVEKDYKVTFQDDKMGTTCIAEEISLAD